MLRVGIMRGGPSSEYEVSLKTGGSVLAHIPRDKYQPFDILVDREGDWHIDGFPTTLEKTARHLDVVFNAMHGEFGEDGTVQRILDQFGVVYTGSRAFASAIAMNKAIAKYYFKQAGLKTPECRVVRGGGDIYHEARRVFATLVGPYVVKPAGTGSSIGVSLVYDFASLVSALNEALSLGSIAIVEEYIEGREVTCGVVEGLSKPDAIYPLLPIEIIPPDHTSFFDYGAKYSGKAQEICPANLKEETRQNIQNAAVAAHRALGARHYSRSDFILSRRGLYILETNTLPGLTEESLLPKALRAGGMELSEFIDYVITLAMKD